MIYELNTILLICFISITFFNERFVGVMVSDKFKKIEIAEHINNNSLSKSLYVFKLFFEDLFLKSLFFSFIEATFSIITSKIIMVVVNRLIYPFFYINPIKQPYSLLAIYIYIFLLPTVYKCFVINKQYLIKASKNYDRK